MTNRNVNVPTIWLDGVIVDHEAVAVEIQVDLVLDGKSRTESFTGVSKCDPADKFDAQLGADLAYWRAVERAAKKNLDRLNGKIKHNDDIREIRKAQANVAPRGAVEIQIPYTNDKIILDLTKNVVIFRGKVYNSLTPLSDAHDLIDENFRRGDVVYFDTDTPPKFRDNYGYVVGRSGGHYMIFHPGIDWMGNHVTYWSPDSVY